MRPEASLWRRSALTLAIGAAGAGLAVLAGLPVAALIGAALATSAASWAGLRLGLDSRLRDAGFMAIGLSLGSGFQADVLERAPDWALSLALLPPSVLATLFLGRAMFVRLLDLDRTSALLAASPGTMSLAISLSADGRGMATQIMAIQSMRILLLSAGLPLLVGWFGGSMAAPMRHPAVFGPVELAGVALAALALGLAIKRTGLPSAFLVGGMLASGLGHVTDLVHGTPPGWLLFAGFTATGAIVGSRFSGIGLGTIRAMLWATLALVGAASVVSAGVALLVAWLTALPFGQVWVAYAPGGVEAMAAIGLALGFDPAYVALHHLLRIGLLTIALPLLTPRQGPQP